LSDRLTTLVISETRTEAHFRSQVGIGSESDCLLGQLKRMFEISDSEADLKVEKSGVAVAEGSVEMQWKERQGKDEAGMG